MGYDIHDNKNSKADVSVMYEDEILPRMRVNKLLRCKLVSKEWFNIIKTPCFINSHLKKSIRNHHFNVVLFNPYPETVGIFSADTLLPSEGEFSISLGQSYKIIGSCNGLLCFVSDSTNDSKEYNLFVVNPATRVENSFRVLPSTNIKGNLQENMKYKYNEGFGFTSNNTSKDYTFVYITGQEIHAYSLKTSSWTRIGDYSCKYCLLKQVHPQARGVATDNALHWFYTDAIGCAIEGVFSLDLATGTQYVSPLLGLKGNPRLVSMKGCLYLVTTRFIYTREAPTNMTQIEVWLLKRYGLSLQDSWVQLYKVQLHIPFSVIPISLMEGGRKVLLELWREQDTKRTKSYVWYDLITKKCDCELYEISNNSIAEACLDTLVNPQCL